MFQVVEGKKKTNAIQDPACVIPPNQTFHLNGESYF